MVRAKRVALIVMVVCLSITPAVLLFMEQPALAACTEALVNYIFRPQPTRDILKTTL